VRSVAIRAELATYGYDASDGGSVFFGFSSSDLAHGVVEGQAEDLGTEVDGVAGQMALGVTNFFAIVHFAEVRA
jgi:hypothetical protein